MTTIASEADLEEWDGTGTAVVTGAFTISDFVTNFPVTMSDGAIFNGDGYTITIDDTSSSTGMFVPGATNDTLTFLNLYIDVTNVTLADGDGLLVTSNNTSGLTINITDAAFLGGYAVPTSGGGVTGSLNANATTNFTGVWCTAVTSNASCGGIGRSTGGGTIKNCVSTGAVTGSNASGFFWRVQGGLNIYDSYALGNVSTGCHGFIWGAEETMLINNCYQAGSLTGTAVAFVGTIYSGKTLTISNSFSQHATATTTASLGFVRTNNGTYTNTSNGNGNSTWEVAGNDPIDDGSLIDDNTSGSGNSNVWNVSTDPFRLEYFLTGDWNSSAHTTAGDDPAYTSTTGGLGDPHITPLIGSVYDLKLSGPVRYFDNNNQDKSKRFIINGSIDEVDDDYRATDMSYFRYMFFSYGEKKMYVDMGFRGTPIKIVYNDGFENVQLQDLSFNKGACTGCNNCEFRVNIKNIKDEHYTKHEMPKLIRNMLTFSVNIPNDNIYTIRLENVNQVNCHPCGIFIKLHNKDKCAQYSGACVKQYKNSNIHKLYDPMSTDVINYPTIQNSKLSIKN
jgi:hypothetical protein